MQFRQTSLVQNGFYLLQFHFVSLSIFRPQDILPLPQVAQSGPRDPKPNKRLGASRCLTSSPEMKRIREEYDEKQRKQKETENRKKTNVTKDKVAGETNPYNRILR